MAWDCWCSSFSVAGLQGLGWMQNVRQQNHRCLPVPPRQLLRCGGLLCASAAGKKQLRDGGGLLVGREDWRRRKRRRGSEIWGRRDGVLVSGTPQEEGKEIVELATGVEYISSPNNPYVKHLVRLRQSRRRRDATASVLVVGTVPLKEICEVAGGFLIDVLLVKDGAEVPEELAGVSRRTVRVSVAAMIKLSGLDSPPETAGVLSFPATFAALEQASSMLLSSLMRKWCPSPRRILVLDSVQDPGNMGALLRTAAAFAWDGVFLLPGSCDPFNDKALRAARGASFRVPVATGEWGHLRDYASANNLRLYAGDPEAKTQLGTAFSLSSWKEEEEFMVLVDGGLCLVLGSEGQGLTEEVNRDCCPIGIPMPGKFESLNVAVAGGILMFLLR